MGLDGKPHVTFGIPGTGMSYKMALGPGLIVAGILLLAVIAGIAYLVAPDTVKSVLHWWQPRWF
jgi:hypothetical protein